MNPTRRKFGQIDKLPSGRFRARYTAPTGELVKAPSTFELREDAEWWLKGEKDLLDAAAKGITEWISPEERNKKAEADATTVEELINRWLAKPEFKVSTAQSHRRKLNSRVLHESIPGKFESLKDLPVTEMTKDRARQWWAEVCSTWPDQRSTNASAYKRLVTAFNFAVELGLIDVNPVKIPGAAKPPRPETRDREVISLAEAEALHAQAPERLKAPVLLLLWSGLRLGELLELRRKDIKGDRITVSRNAQRITDPDTNKQVMITIDTPKTDAGYRSLVLPAAVAESLRVHMREFMDSGADALVVTTQAGAQMLDTNFRNRFNTIAKKAGRPDITPHDCRRFFGTRLVSPDAETGRGAPVSLEEARRLMGHETVEQLMEYQRVASGFEARAAGALNSLIEPTPAPEKKADLAELLKDVDLKDLAQYLDSQKEDQK